MTIIDYPIQECVECGEEYNLEDLLDGICLNCISIIQSLDVEEYFDRVFGCPHRLKIPKKKDKKYEKND